MKDNPTKDEVLAGVRLQELKLSQKALTNTCKVLTEANLELQHQLNHLVDIQSSQHRKTEIFKQKQNSQKHSVAAVFPATDWHVEEVVTLEQTNGKNFYNLTESEKRINRYYNKILQLLDWQNSFSKVTELWHPLLGDLMTGYIHDELIESNQLSPTEASVFLRDRICDGINLLLSKTKLPIMIPTCIGNHGRTTKRKQIKTGYKNNYEWLLYKTLAKLFEKEKRVNFMIGIGYHNIQTVAKRPVRFHHGDGLRYYGGVGGITIPVNKAIAQWDKVNKVDFDVFGHWHTFHDCYPKWVSCGSLMGYNEFAVEIKADFQHPTQTWIVIDEYYGLTDCKPIFITKAHKLQEK